MLTQRLIVTGHVQGVGFRPFIYRLARQHDLTGSVTNRSGEVVIICQGNEQSLQDFAQQVIAKAPPLAKPLIEHQEKIESPAFDSFTIAASHSSESPDIHIPPDYFTCDDCLAEMTDPQQRRYRYPFTNCTQCGPRYTLIEALPYDRPNTSMKDFPLCADCQLEYSDPNDRRFHAQPLACKKCGPTLSFQDETQSILGNDASLQACIKALQAGKIIAVKGIGGYHLMCDALNENAIETLRQRKHRPDKPLAVMFPMSGNDGLETIRQFVIPGNEEERLVTDPQRPIVLTAKRADCSLPDAIAPGLNEIGVFLPYSPLHHLLLTDFNGPLIATSGNVSGEPVITDNKQAETRLQQIADAFLLHNRPIVRPADDSVKRVIAGKPRNLRLGRGLAPLEIPLQIKAPAKLSAPVLAVGGHLKSTVALAWDNRLVISPHISDLDTARGLQIFEQVIHDLQKLYQVDAEHIICDAHPAYQSHRWAKKQPLPFTPVWHHHAHAAVVSGEYPDIKNWLMFCWDGVGLGADNSLWGGETFYGKPGNWQHVAAFRPFYLPGADKAGREPWRSAAALRWQTGDFTLPVLDNASLALQAWQKKINTPQSSAAGRLFDAAANMVLQVDSVSYEGQGPMQLEAIASHHQDSITMPITPDTAGIMRIDWSSLLKSLQDANIPQAQRAAIFHNSMAQTVIDQALLFNKEFEINAIGLSGGVFQNRRLVETIMRLGMEHELDIRLPEIIPVNDGGLSYGQVIEFLGLH